MSLNPQDVFPTQNKGRWISYARFQPTWSCPDNFEAGDAVPHPRLQYSFTRKKKGTVKGFHQRRTSIKGHLRRPEGLDLGGSVSAVFLVHQRCVGQQD